MVQHKPVAPGEVSLVNGKFLVVVPFSNVLTSPQLVGSCSRRLSGSWSISDLNGDISPGWFDPEFVPLLVFFGVECSLVLWECGGIFALWLVEFCWPHAVPAVWVCVVDTEGAEVERVAKTRLLLYEWISSKFSSRFLFSAIEENLR